MKTLIIIKTGDSLPALVTKRGDFEDWIVAGMGNRYRGQVAVAAVHRGEAPPAFDRIGGVIVTGSHAMVTDGADWSERTAAWLADAVRRDIPILGICFGHQVLAHALGGQVGPMPAGPEFGTVPVSLTAAAARDPLFDGLPRTVDVQTSHFQSVLELPAEAVLLAASETDPHSAFRYGRCAWGVQFHPEYDAEIANAYVNELNSKREQAGEDAALPLDCRETIAGNLILRRFADYVAKASNRKASNP